MLELRKINKTFKTPEGSIEAVKDVSFTVEPGEIYGLIGLSGAGKSTLIRCINMLEKPDSGQILFEGEDLALLSQKELRKTRQQIGMIFQHFNLFEQKTVKENIAYPLELHDKDKSAISKRVDELLGFVELTDKTNSYPSELSGGQKQRVAIARALATSPKLLLSDEGTSALDPATSILILDLLRRTVDELKISIVMITHQMEVARRICDHVAVMEGGEIIEQNTVKGLFLEPKHPRTIALIRSLDEERPLSELSAFSHDDVYRLGFAGGEVSRPLISDVSRRFEIDINLLAGDINILQDEQVGWLAVTFPEDDQEKVKLALAYLEEKNVHIKKIDPNSTHNPEKTEPETASTSESGLPDIETDGSGDNSAAVTSGQSEAKGGDING
ncbi:MAG TPA: methionine ABC transporter ATP-binding protein [Clostridiaceae bacterium]|nr:methionine ABC transporter ATP-binding protein [Clostridiaceae bacterium]